MIAFKLAFVQNNKNLLVATLLFQTILPCGITNENPFRPVGQKKTDSGDAPNSAVWFERSFETPFSTFAGQIERETHITPVYTCLWGQDH